MKDSGKAVRRIDSIASIVVREEVASIKCIELR